MLAERQAAVEAILKAGHIPAGMELFTAGDDSQLKIIKEWIEASDIFILILGGRYGTLEPKTNKSYIELEYRHAKKAKIPSFAIVIKKEALQEKIKKYGDEVQEQANLSKYKKFRKYTLCKMAHFYKDVKDIQLSIFQNINQISENTNFSGWIPGKNVREIEEVLKENIELRKSNEAIQNKLDKMIQTARTNDKKYDGYSYVQIKEFLKSEKVAIKNIKTNVSDLFICLSDHFNIGVGNSHSNSKIERFLFYKAIPTLLNYGLAEKLNAPLNARWGRAHTSKLGHNFLAETKSKMNHNFLIKNKNLGKTVVKMISKEQKMKKGSTHVVKEKNSEFKTTNMASTRIDRILSIMRFKNVATTDILLGHIKISTPRGAFGLYSTPDKNKYYVIAIHNYEFTIDNDLADIRVMIENWREQREQFEFVIVTNDNLKAEKDRVRKVFERMINQAKAKKFRFSIWDNTKLFKLEKRHRLR